jgi:hypothetical protein
MILSYRRVDRAKGLCESVSVRGYLIIKVRECLRRSAVKNLNQIRIQIIQFGDHGLQAELPAAFFPPLPHQLGLVGILQKL